MLDKIKRLGTDTAIYGISTILGRFLSYLLTPFYTNVLVTSEYGIVTYLFSLIAIVNVVYNYGMESAFFKYYSSVEPGEKKRTFSVPFLSITATSAVFTAVIMAFSGSLGDALNIPAHLGSIIPMAAGVLALDALAIIPFAVLRMERRAKTFAFIKLANILVNVALNIILLVVFRQGVEGIFVSALAASAATIVLLLPVIRRHLALEFDGNIYRLLLRFGLPLIPAGLATAAIQVINRPILRALTDDSTVGVFQANYRLGIFMMLFVSMYDYAWRPFYFSTAREPDAKAVFGRILTYLVLIMAGIFLVISLFVDDIVRITVFGRFFIHPDYWGGLSIVPIILLGYAFLGITTNLSAGIYIEKKTHLMPPVTFVGALVNIAGNYLLIPVAGMTGAACATLLAYFSMAAVLYMIVQRVYPVRYEFGRIGKIALATAVIFGGYFLLYSPQWPAAGRFSFKLGLCALFGLLMYVMRFFDQREMNLLRRLFTRKPSAPPQTPAETDPGENLGE